MTFWRPSMELDDWAYRRPMALDLADGAPLPAVGEILWLGFDPLGGALVLRVEAVQGTSVRVIRLPQDDWPDSPVWSWSHWRLRGPSSARVIERV